MNSRRRIASPPRLHYNGITAGIWDQRNGAKRPFAPQQFLAAHVRFGSFSTISVTWLDVRFTPNSDRLLRRREVTLCAISDQSAVQQNCGLFDHLVGNS
jgi:hypothetical protein